MEGSNNRDVKTLRYYTKGQRDNLTLQGSHIQDQDELKLEGRTSVMYRGFSFIYILPTCPLTCLCDLDPGIGWDPSCPNEMFGKEIIVHSRYDSTTLGRNEY